MRTAGPAAVLAAAILLLSASAAPAGAFTTGELVRLKRAGISEETIVFLVEQGCGDADRIVRLAEEGFREETIRAIVRAEATGERRPKANDADPEKPASVPAVTEASRGNAARFRIEWYMVYRGEPLRRNFQESDGGKVSLAGGRTVRVDFRTDSGSGLLEFFRKKPFPSPFDWDLEGSDSYETGRGGFACVLTSAAARKGKPPADGSQYWVLFLDPADPAFCGEVEKALAAVKGSGPGPFPNGDVLRRGK